MQEKRKTVLTVVALVLSVSLLAGGIVSAAVISGKTKAVGKDVDTDGSESNVEVVEGQIKPEKLENGGWGIWSSDFCLEFYETENGYGTQITSCQGEVVEEQVNPINIQIKKPNAEDDYLGTRVETEMIAEDYETVEAQGNAIIATAEVQSRAGSIFAVTDQYQCHLLKLQL